MQINYRHGSSKRHWSSHHIPVFSQNNQNINVFGFGAIYSDVLKFAELVGQPIDELGKTLKSEFWQKEKRVSYTNSWYLKGI